MSSSSRLSTGLLATFLFPAFLHASAESEARTDEAMRKILKPVAITTQAIVKATGEADARLQAVDFFDLKIPTEKIPEQVHLSFEPKLGDVVRREFIRLPVELSYTPVKNLLITAGLTPVVPNPFNYEKNLGLGMYTTEVRYDWHPKALFFETILFGVGNDIPLGKTPVDLINGFTHIKPFVGLSKNLGSEKWKLVLEASEDVAAKWIHDAEDFRKFNVLRYGPALIYKPNEFGYFAQYAVKYYDKLDTDFYGHFAQVGAQWDIPSVRSTKWGLPGKWEISLSLSSETNEFDKSGFGVNTRVRWKFDLKKPKIQQ